MKVKTLKLNVTILSCTNIQNTMFSSYENLRKLPAIRLYFLYAKFVSNFTALVVLLF